MIRCSLSKLGSRLACVIKFKLRGHCPSEALNRTGLLSVCGVLVIALAYVSLTQLDLLSVDSQRWGLHEHQRHLVKLGMAEVVVGTALALSALLGCFDVAVAKTTHRAVRRSALAN
ncbi:hypothetical protein HPB47_011409 [Ixodes persulcatus]|uniref:Uncharacterized protein n=1 Tax=Ixodes persulcatus TaxID=34615 RepID=A0AC60NWC0_IXOPE|nr:hypothetical protein HPB47_011409 [Ixodes persulcatus]